MKLKINKTGLAIAFLTSFGLIARAQQPPYPELPYGVHPGTVTTLEGQTIQGYVINKDNSTDQSKNYNNQKECVFYTDYKDNRSRSVYHPSDLTGYSIENNLYKSLNYSGNIGFGKASKNFIYLAKAGAVSTYLYRAPEEQIFWQKGNEEPVSNASMLLSFKKSILKLVGDNADIAAKVERKEKGYSMMYLTQIIDEYNAAASSQK